jgi:hypothetical protein
MPKKWIRLKAPHVALNAPNIRNKFSMTKTVIVPWDWDADKIIAAVPKDARHLVFNCHGFPTKPDFPVPHLSIGRVIQSGNVGVFDALARIASLRVIWLSACALSSSAAGSDFCAEIAKRSVCYVASTLVGVPDWSGRAGHVEDYSYATPVYYRSDGVKINRSDFFKMGAEFGFAPV